jgi:hypothetical protein
MKKRLLVFIYSCITYLKENECSEYFLKIEYQKYSIVKGPGDVL